MKEEIQSNLCFREAFREIGSDAFVTVICLAPKTYRLMTPGLGIVDVKASYNAMTEIWEVSPLSSTVSCGSREARMIAAFRNQEGMN